MPTIYLARHATPDWNRKDLIYYLPPGPPLTPVGLAEARLLGEFFKQACVTRLFTSPLERALHTAQTAAEVASLPVETLASLTELQPGETHDSVRSRLMPSINRLLIECDRLGPAAIVTHGGPVAALLKEFGMGADAYSKLQLFDHSNPLPPAGVWKVHRQSAAEPWELELAFVPDLTSRERSA